MSKPLATVLLMDVDLGKGPPEIVAAWRRLSKSDQDRLLAEAMAKDTRRLLRIRKKSKAKPRRGIGSY